MNEPYIIGAIATVVFVTSYYFLYRAYKRIARRCRRKDCGRTDVRRVCKIILPVDEDRTSFRSPAGNWRWFLRRVVKLTFTTCKCGWVELVKIDTDPISMWHIFWANRFHKDQYYMEEPKLIEAALRKFRQLHLGGKHLAELDGQASDTPPLSLRSLVRDHFEEVSKLLGKV